MVTVDVMSLGQLLVHYRRAAELGQEGLAERAGISVRPQRL